MRGLRRGLAATPSPKLLAMGRKAIRRAVFSAEFIEGSAETLPLEDECIDTIVPTWTMYRITVVGLTSTMAFKDCGQIRYSHTQRSRSAQKSRSRPGR